MVAVGTRISPRPPHRSRRALLTHRAPPSGQTSCDERFSHALARRAAIIRIKLIEDAFGDLPLAALADRRVRGEFKTWRDGFAATPRKADFAWTVLARIMSFAKDRGIIATNPCEKGGRLHVADRADKFWGEQEIATLLVAASQEIKLALVLA